MDLSGHLQVANLKQICDMSHVKNSVSFTVLKQEFSKITQNRLIENLVKSS